MAARGRPRSGRYVSFSRSRNRRDSPSDVALLVATLTLQQERLERRVRLKTTAPHSRSPRCGGTYRDRSRPGPSAPGLQSLLIQVTTREPVARFSQRRSKQLIVTCRTGRRGGLQQGETGLTPTNNDVRRSGLMLNGSLPSATHRGIAAVA